MDIRRNAIWNVLEAVVFTFVLFFLYKVILKFLGVSALGVWSLVVATTSLARAADLGAAGGLGRYVALARKEKRSPDEAVMYIETAMIANVILYIVVGGALYWPSWVLLGSITRGDSLRQARDLLPLAILSFVLLNITNVVTAALIGLARADLKSRLNLIGLFAQVLVSLALLKNFGLRGLALGQVAQYFIVIVGGWFLVLRIIYGAWTFRFPIQIWFAPLKELMGFGMRLQAINLASFVFDPTTKYVLSALGGLPALGLYELASRGVLQARQFVVTPAQNLTPIFVVASGEIGSLGESYQSAFRMISSISFFFVVGLSICAPFLSFIWLGKLDDFFIGFSLILSLGWGLNILAVPGYYLGIASGILRWNILGGAFTAVVSAPLAFILFRPLGIFGLALGAMLGVGGGALTTMLMNCRMLGITAFVTPKSYLNLWREIFRSIMGSAVSIYCKLSSRNVDG